MSQRVYGPSQADGNSHVINGDQYVDRVEQYKPTVQHFYSAPQATAQPYPHPTIVLPFRRNRDFIERDEFHTLWSRRRELDSRLALVGLGGIGKSHVAIEFAYRIYEESPNTWVFWVHASSLSRFEQSYKTIAEALQIPGRHEPQVDIFLLVRSWLSRREQPAWTMIVDNADDEQLILGGTGTGQANAQIGATSSSISSYLPSVAHGQIIVTTRSWVVARGIVGYDNDIIPLTPMSNVAAIQLLEKKLQGLTTPHPREHLIRLAQELDYLPLAITQAAAYIQQRTPRVTVLAYIEILQRGDEYRRRLLQTALYDPWRDGQASNSIIVTWHQSFAYIQQTRVSASWLLSLMSLFDREAIPETLLRGGYMVGSSSSEDQDQRFDDDVAMLQDFNLINFDLVNSAFDMHRLVQFTTRQWLYLNNQIEWWRQRYHAILLEHFPVHDYQDWPWCQILLPHVYAMMVTEQTSPSAMEDYLQVLTQARRYVQRRGQDGQAEMMARHVYFLRLRHDGPESIKTYASMQALGTSLYNQGKDREAEELQRAALAGCTRQLGANHMQTLKSAHGLGLLLHEQARYAEAEALYRWVVEGRQQQLGEDAVETLKSTADLGMTLLAQGKTHEAEVMIRRVLEKQNEQLGPDHPRTLRTVDDLGLVLGKQEKYTEAEAIHRQALDVRKRHFGEHHPETLHSLLHVADAVESQGRNKEAEVMFRLAFERSDQAHGAHHPSTLTSLQRLSRVLQIQGFYPEAETRWHQYHEACEKAYGREHIETARSVLSIAILYRKMSRFDQAVIYYSRALSSLEHKLGHDHSETAKCRQEFEALSKDGVGNAE